MAVVKANYVKRGKGEKGRAKATIRYITHRRDRDGHTVTRALFGYDGALTKEQAYRMIDDAQKGTIFYRIVISPAPKHEDRYKDLDLSEITIHTMLALEERLGKQIQFVATMHDDHSPHRHIHSLVLVQGARLNREDFQALRLEATERALSQRRMRDRIRGHHMSLKRSRTIGHNRLAYRGSQPYQSYTCPLCHYHQALPSLKPRVSLSSLRPENAQGTNFRNLPDTEKGGRLSAKPLTMKRFLYHLNLFLSRLISFFSHSGELHHARFARVHELSDILTDSLPTDSLLLGLNNFSRILHVKSTQARRELGNCLVVAPTRGGKGLLAVSQLLTWKHSVIVNDIKGDLFDQTAGYRRTLGKVYVVDPDGIGNRYDPLLTKRTEKDLLSAATHLLHRPDEGEGRIFTERATVMLTQLLLAAREEHAPPFPFVRQMVRLGLQGSAKRLFRISSDLATQFLEAELDEANFDDRFLLSSWGTLSVRMRFLLTDSVVRCLTGTDFTAKDVMCSEKPVTLYLRWPERDLLMLSPLVRLFWESLVNELLHTYDAAKGQSCRPVLLLIDEAGQAPIPNLQQYAATVAGRGISLWIAVQALSQLDGLYGRHKADTIRNNCDSKIFYRQASLETAEYVERSLGRRSGYAHSQTLHSGEETSESLGEQAVSLLTTQDINQLNHDEIIGWHSNRKPFRARRMDWRGFPILKQRRAIPPPQLSALPQIEESLLPSPWGRGERWPLAPIDPDNLN